MGVVQKIGNFLGVKKFADAVASTGRIVSGSVEEERAVQAKADDSMTMLTYALRNEKDPVKKQKLQQVLQSQLNQKGVFESEIDPGLNLSTKEIYGSAANVGLNVLTPGAFKGTKTAIIAKNAALGAGFGAASGLEKNRSASGVLGSATGGAIIGAGIGVAGLMAKAAKDFIGKKTPEWLMNKAVKPALADLKKNVKYGSDTLGKQLLDEGVKGGPRKLLEIADNQTNQLESQLQKTLTSPGLEEARVTRQQIIPYVQELVRSKSNVPGLKSEVQKIEGIIQSMPEKMTLLEANQMKRDIYRELRDVAYKLDPKLGVKASTLKQIAKGLKDGIEEAVGGTVVRDINQKLSIYGRLENAMVDQLAREMRNNGVGLTDAILLAGGGPTGVLALLRHIPQSAGTYVAQGLSKAGKVLEGTVAQGVKDTIRKGAFNLPGGFSEGTVPETVLNETANAEEVGTPFIEFKVTHYNPKDPNQTKKNADGVGAFNEPVEFGDVAMGLRKYPQGTLIEIEELKDVLTPYGMGIFRVNDKKNIRFDEGDENFDIAVPEDYEGKDDLRKRIGNNKFRFRVVSQPKEQE